MEDIITDTGTVLPSTSSFPTTPLIRKKRIIIKEQKKNSTSNRDTSVIVTTMLAHTSHLMKAVDITNELIKILLRELYRPKSQKEIHPIRPGAPLHRRQCHNLSSAMITNSQIKSQKPHKQESSHHHYK